MATNAVIPLHKNLNHLVSITTRSGRRKLDQLENLLIIPFVSSVSKQSGKLYDSYVSKTDARKVKRNDTESKPEKNFLSRPNCSSGSIIPD